MRTHILLVLMFYSVSFAQIGMSDEFEDVIKKISQEAIKVQILSYLKSEAPTFSMVSQELIQNVIDESPSAEEFIESSLSTLTWIMYMQHIYTVVDTVTSTHFKQLAKENTLMFDQDELSDYTTAYLYFSERIKHLGAKPEFSTADLERKTHLESLSITENGRTSKWITYVSRKVPRGKEKYALLFDITFYKSLQMLVQNILLKRPLETDIDRFKSQIYNSFLTYKNDVLANQIRRLNHTGSSDIWKQLTSEHLQQLDEEYEQLATSLEKKYKRLAWKQFVEITGAASKSDTLVYASAYREILNQLKKQEAAERTSIYELIKLQTRSLLLRKMNQASHLENDAYSEWLERLLVQTKTPKDAAFYTIQQLTQIKALRKQSITRLFIEKFYFPYQDVIKNGSYKSDAKLVSEMSQSLKEILTEWLEHSKQNEGFRLNYTIVAAGSYSIEQQHMLHFELYDMLRFGFYPDKTYGMYLYAGGLVERFIRSFEKNPNGHLKVGVGVQYKKIYLNYISKVGSNINQFPLDQSISLGYELPIHYLFD